jgi:hypothetical protein
MSATEHGASLMAACTPRTSEGGQTAAELSEGA